MCVFSFTTSLLRRRAVWAKWNCAAAMVGTDGKGAAWQAKEGAAAAADGRTESCCNSIARA